ncbi:hypothetical protein TorRG33x02_247500 [Trema orientale]|uniref:Uncharacterized protein n=1 Tax=Trema orientale TaxID=63057 RepID=A0A2P5DLK2_TREOI|nr:hypothetical protein TorRG33x02_247500 [Trema orientale]
MGDFDTLPPRIWGLLGFSGGDEASLGENKARFSGGDEASLGENKPLRRYVPG